jgi:3D-(3,5/4)-trihydroxycyclohexane-1,2-dione acylhydrolase (decyclizing)
LAVVADARFALEELTQALAGYRVDAGYRERVDRYRTEWEAEVERIYKPGGERLTQGEVIGLVNEISASRDVVINAAGSMPGDLHKLWRTRDPNGYHMEYGYSTMGYEIAGGLGIKMAAPDRDVWVLVGDGSYLMMAQEIVTSLQEGLKLNIVLVDNHGFSSIGGLSQACGSGGFATEFRYRENGDYSGEVLPIDLAANAASLGACAIRAGSRVELAAALERMKTVDRTSVVVVETDINERVPGYESWLDVPIAEVSEVENVRNARKQYDESRKRERYYL